MNKLEEIVSAWTDYLSKVSDWQSLVGGVEPKFLGCGAVYEIENPISRPSESIAIADMRNLELAEPHYHANGETEIYFVLQGAGKSAIGDKISDLSPGVCVVTPPDTVHITLPGEGLVLAVVNTPAFKVSNYKPVNVNDDSVTKMITGLKS